MRILVVAHFQGDGSPTASFIHSQIIEYIKMGHTVRVVVPVPMLKRDYFEKRISKKLNKVMIDNIEHCFVRYVSASNIGEYSINMLSLKCSIIDLWKKIIADFYPDVIHAHTIGLDSEIAYYIGKRLSIPVILTVHGSDVERLLNKPDEQIKLYCNHMDKIIAVSSVLKNKLIKYDEENKFDSILNGFTAKAGRADDILRDPLRIIQVGNLVPSKRVDVTIDAFNRIHNVYLQSSLIIVGDGPERLYLEEKCRSLGLSDFVTFKGQLDNEFVLAEMEKSSYFVMASSPEGFGIVYLEAMSRGCLVIGSQGEGISDLINNGQNGYLVKVDDADEIANIIISLIERPERRDEIAQHGMQDVQQLTWENNARKYLDVFQSLV